jgi:hypothetical protein
VTAASRVVRVVVNGDVQTVDLSEVLEIRDPGSERLEAPAMVAWWGAVWADAVQAAEREDAAYRHFQAAAYKTLLEQDAKVAEWKAKALVESTTEWLTQKTRVVDAERNANAAKAIFEAYQVKADMLARLVRREDSELYHGRDVGREPTRGADSGESRARPDEGGPVERTSAGSGRGSGRGPEREAASDPRVKQLAETNKKRKSARSDD